MGRDSEICRFLSYFDDSIQRDDRILTEYVKINIYDEIIHSRQWHRRPIIMIYVNSYSSSIEMSNNIMGNLTKRKLIAWHQFSFIISVLAWRPDVLTPIVSNVILNLEIDEYLMYEIAKVLFAPERIHSITFNVDSAHRYIDNPFIGEKERGRRKGSERERERRVRRKKFSLAVKKS